MAYLGFWNKASDWGGAAVGDSGTAAAFDSAYQDEAIRFNNNTTGGINWGGGEGDIWFHFKFYFFDTTTSGGGSADGYWWYLLDPSGNRIAYADLVNGQVIYYVSGDGGSTFSAGSTAINIPGYLGPVTIDIHFQTNNGGNTTLDVYHDLVSVAAQSTAWSTTVDPQGFLMQHFDFSSNGTADYWYSEVMLATEDTRGLRVATLTPNADGDATADWAGDFNNILDKGDGTGITTDTATDREDWNLSAYNGPASPTSIRGVFSQMWAHPGTTGPSKIDPYVRISSTNYDAAIDVTPEFRTPVVAEWAVNPNTAVDWIDTDFAALIAGVEAVT